MPHVSECYGPNGCILDGRRVVFHPLDDVGVPGGYTKLVEAHAKAELRDEDFKLAVEAAKVRIRERRARWFKWFPWRLSIVRR